MGWIAAASLAWFGVDLVSAFDAACMAVMGRASRVLAFLAISGDSLSE